MLRCYGNGTDSFTWIRALAGDDEAYPLQCWARANGHNANVTVTQSETNNKKITKRQTRSKNIPGHTRMSLTLISTHFWEAAVFFGTYAQLRTSQTPDASLPLCAVAFLFENAIGGSYETHSVICKWLVSMVGTAYSAEVPLMADGGDLLFDNFGSHFLRRTV
jgi:hypothetical protein